MLAQRGICKLSPMNGTDLQGSFQMHSIFLRDYFKVATQVKERIQIMKFTGYIQRKLQQF
jgi:hypothetical protein